MKRLFSCLTNRCHKSYLDAAVDQRILQPKDVLLLWNLLRLEDEEDWLSLPQIIGEVLSFEDMPGDCEPGVQP